VTTLTNRVRVQIGGCTRGTHVYHPNNWNNCIHRITITMTMTMTMTVTVTKTERQRDGCDAMKRPSRQGGVIPCLTEQQERVARYSWIVEAAARGCVTPIDGCDAHGAVPCGGNMTNAPCPCVRVILCTVVNRVACARAARLAHSSSPSPPSSPSSPPSSGPSSSSPKASTTTSPRNR